MRQMPNLIRPLRLCSMESFKNITDSRRKTASLQLTWEKESATASHHLIRVASILFRLGMLYNRCFKVGLFRIRCGRSIRGYPFNPLLTGDDYLIMQQKVKMALEAIKEKDLKGVYYPLAGMTKDVQNQLIEGSFNVYFFILMFYV